MHDPSPGPSRHAIELRVRYHECDPMGVAHHSVYPIWLEMARTELCRAGGVSYRAMEAEGILLAVTRLEIEYRAPARYDDRLTVDVRLERVTRARLEHRYRILRDGLELTRARTVLACVDSDGRPRPLPERFSNALNAAK